MTEPANPLPRADSSRARAWWAIGVFTGMPWLLGLCHYCIKPREALPKSEVALKAELLSGLGRFDTVIVGDSRVLRLGGDAFAKRHWSYFNMGLSGLSPANAVTELIYAMNRDEIRRVIVGVSFENMAEERPFEHAPDCDEPAFRQLDLSVMGVSRPPPDGFDALRVLLPVGQATRTVHHYYHVLGGRELEPAWRRDGTVVYDDIESSVHKGTWDYARYVGPPELTRYWVQSEARYLDRGRLAEDAKELYVRMFDFLREKRITTLVFETGRIDAYREAIESNPVLSRLHAEWKAFYRSEAHGCVRFVDADQLRDVHAQKDFVDPVHFIGDTEGRVTERLVDALAELQSLCEGEVPAQKRSVWQAGQANEG